jgi:hypothetical protein
VCPNLVAAAYLQRVKSSWFMWDEQQWFRTCKQFDIVDPLGDVAPILIRVLVSRGLKDVEIAKRLGYVGTETIYKARKANKIPKDYRLQIRKKLCQKN